MDLLSALPEDIFNLVLSYLRVKDILKASVVCKGWYQMFGQSNECIQKVTVRYSDDNCKNDVDALLHSGREYQNLFIRFNHGGIKESGVEINIRAILKRFSKSIVKLQTSHDFQRICELPKLKELKYQQWHYSFKNVNYFCSSGLIATCLNVSKLDISSSSLNGKHLEILQEAIQNMRNLKELSLDEVGFLKNIRLEDCKFKLEGFESRSNTSITDFSNFLKHHQSTLKSIRIININNEDITFILSEFPKLHTLRFSIGYSYGKNAKDWIIPENSTIKNLIINCSYYCPKQQDTIADIFTKVKNLQYIRLIALHSRYINAFFACKSLTLVKYDRFGDGVTDDQKACINNNENIKFLKVPFTY